MASDIVPIPVSAKTTAELSAKLARIQAAAGGKVAIVSIYYDTGKKEHVAWYLPLRFNGGVF